MMDKDTLEQFRYDLPVLRAFAGWTSAELANMLGVSRMTMINIENKSGAIHTVHYLAIRKLLEDAKKYDQTLKDVMDLLDVMRYHDDFLNSANEIINRKSRGRSMVDIKNELIEWFTNWEVPV